MIRKIIFHKSYFVEFYQQLSVKVQEKIEYVFYIVQYSEIIPKKFFKYIEDTDGIYEIRIQHGNNIFRIFCFFDRDKLVVLLHGIQKKSQKIPNREIQKAEQLKKEYFTEKIKE